MSEEVKDKMLEVAKILFKNNVPIEQAKFIGDFIETQNNKLQQKENIIKEAREKANIIQFTIESNDKRYGNLYVKLKDTLQGQELLEILDKEVN